MTQLDSFLGVDIGGTKMRAGLVSRSGQILDVKLTSTPRDPEEVLGALFDIVNEAISSADLPVRGIGIGAAGLVDVNAGIVRYAPNLSYREVPITAAIAEKFGLPVTLDNDATCAGYAEFRLGAGRDTNDMVMVTLGTGIGGGFIFGGHVYRGAHGFAAEIGHMVVDPDGPRCGCGQLGCWERLASGTALGEMAREAAGTSPGSAILEAAGGDIAEVRGEHVSAAALSGDRAAIEVVQALGRNVGAGLANLGNIIDPKKFVIGGGLARLGEILLEPARMELAAKLEGTGYRPEIPVVQASLGDDAGMIGGALMVADVS